MMYLMSGSFVHWISAQVQMEFIPVSKRRSSTLPSCAQPAVSLTALVLSTYPSFSSLLVDTKFCIRFVEIPVLPTKSEPSECYGLFLFVLHFLLVTLIINVLACLILPSVLPT